MLIAGIIGIQVSSIAILLYGTQLAVELVSESALLVLLLVV